MGDQRVLRRYHDSGAARAGATDDYSLAACLDCKLRLDLRSPVADRLIPTPILSFPPRQEIQVLSVSVGYMERCKAWSMTENGAVAVRLLLFRHRCDSMSRTGREAVTLLL